MEKENTAMKSHREGKKNPTLLDTYAKQKTHYTLLCKNKLIVH